MPGKASMPTASLPLVRCNDLKENSIFFEDNNIFWIEKNEYRKL